MACQELGRLYINRSLELSLLRTHIYARDPNPSEQRIARMRCNNEFHEFHSNFAALKDW